MTSDRTLLFHGGTATDPASWIGGSFLPLELLTQIRYTILKNMHPNHYTLSLLKHLLDKAEHTLFPEKRLKEMHIEYDAFVKDHQVTQEEIEALTGKFGREIWPYQEALEELYKRHGKQKEEAMVQEQLSAELRTKYEKFLAGGGDLHDFRHGADIESHFTSEEKFEIGQAEVDAHHTVLQEIASACNIEHKPECEEVINEHKEKLKRIEKKLAALREMATSSEKWKPEIEEKIRAFENSFGYLSKTFHEEDIDGTIDYYQGVIESPEFE